MLDGEHIIIARAIGGEPEAFGLLYDHYQPQIYRFVVLKVGHREDAEDMTHQVFLSAWKNMAGYQDLGHPFSSWLYQIARNHVIDYYRGKRPEVAIETDEAEAIPAQDDHEEELDQTLTLDRVTEAIQMLTLDYQDVIIMRFVEELSVRETAEALGKSEGAVKVMQHRAVRALRKLLKPS